MRRFIFVLCIVALGMNLYSRTLSSPVNNVIPAYNEKMRSSDPVGQSMGNRYNLNERGTVAPLNYRSCPDHLRGMSVNSDMIPPSIQYLTPIVQDTVFNSGPFAIFAMIQDSSGIDTAWVVYQIDGGSNQFVPMIRVSDSTFVGAIPSITYNHRVDYHVHAVDNSILHNVGDATNNWFYIKRIPPDIIVGTESLTSGFPFWMGCGYTRSVSVYKPEEIRGYGSITNLAWNVATTISSNCFVNVYIKSTPSTEISGYYWNDLVVGATQVFSGYSSFATSGWKNFPLTVPFNYTSGNIMIFCEAFYGGSGISNYPTFYCSDAPGTHYFDYHNSGTYFSFMGFPSATRPNLKIGFQQTNNTDDAGITEITEPNGTVIGNALLPVKVVLKNFAIDTLHSAIIKWSLDGVLQDSLSWSGTLPPAVTSIPFIIDNAMFAIGPHTIKAWTEKPNGNTDQSAWQDSSRVDFYACTSILNGNYTIGGGGDFATFHDAISTLLNCGVSGPVTFNVANGTYVGRMDITEIPGASAVNTVTFQSASGNYNDVIITDSATTLAENYVVNLNGTDYIRFKNITIQSKGANYATVLYISNGATYNIFEGNHLLGVPTASPNTTVLAIIYSPSGMSLADSVNTFDRNVIENGSMGITWIGPSPSVHERKTTLIDNIFINQSYTGIYIRYQDRALVEGNTVISNTTFSNYSAVYIDNSNNNLRFIKNYIKLSCGGNGIYITDYNGIAGNSGLIANNMISFMGINSGIGINCSDTKDLKIYNNSVNMYTVYGSKALIVSNTTTSLNNDIKNNIFAYTGPSHDGLAVNISNTAGISAMDYNDLYSTGTNLGYWTANQANLAAWRAASLKDSNSVSVNPEFFSAADLHTLSMNIDNLGNPVSQVTDDIDGEPRSLSSPDIGADEMAVPAYEAKLTAILLPLSSCSQTSAEDVSITVKNNGLDAISNLDAYYVMNNGTPVHEVIAGPIPSAATYTYTFATKADLSIIGNYEFEVYVNNPADGYLPNDSILHYVVYNGFDFLSGNYTQGFENSENYSDWSKLSVNGDNYTWAYPISWNPHTGTMSARFNNSSTNTNGDWLFSRCFPLQAGGNYEISYWYNGGSSASASKLNLKVGLSPTPAGMNQLLDSMPNILNTSYQQSVSLFTVPVTGNYYFGWYAYTNPGSITMNIDDINIKYFSNDNLATIDIIAPVDECTYGSEAVTVKIVNVGFDTIQDPFTLGYWVTGNSTPITETVNYILLPGDSVMHTFSTPALFDMNTDDSTFQINGFGLNSGSILFLNDTVSKFVTFSASPADPVVVNDTITYGSVATLQGISPYMKYWFDAPSGGSFLDTSSQFITPVLYGNTTYYLEVRNDHDAYVGAYDRTIGTVNVLNTSYNTIFNVLNPHGITLKSVDIFPFNSTSGNPFTIVIQNSSSQQIASYSGLTTAISGQRQTVPLNISIPYGTGYKIGFSAMPSLYRNTSGASYPYTIPGIISITGTSYSSNAINYLYHWRVGANDACVSHRVPASVIVTGAPDIDASVMSIVEPDSAIFLGTRNVSVVLRNYGSTTLTDLDLGWSVNGTAQTPFHWNGSLSSGAIDTVTIGAYNFVYTPYPGLNEVVAWCYHPNSLLDSNSVNDTASAIINAHDPYAGTYHIKTNSPDFDSFNEAVLALSVWGVSGPVVILADTGTYVEQIALSEIPGASNVNTITFRSITGSNADVIIQYAATAAANNYVVKLNGADYIAFEDLTIKSVSVSNYARVVELSNGANYNRFENNVIQSILYNGTNANNEIASVNLTTSVASNYNRFIGNRILNGSYGVYCYGVSTAYKQGNHFDENEISGWKNYGIYMSYSDSGLIRNNVISTVTTGTQYAIYNLYCNNGCRITGNKVINTTNYIYCIYLSNCNLTATNPTIIANNFLSMTGFSYGIYVSTSSYVNIYFNSMNISGASQIASSGIYQTGSGTQINIVNNNIKNTADGFAYVIGNPSAIVQSDYNNLYTTGTVLGYWGGDQNSLAMLQATSGREAHSTSIIPEFYSQSDLHCFSFNLFRTGTPIAGYTTDIDGELRYPSNPCVGADEFQLRPLDVGITHIDGPIAPNSADVFKIKVTLSNCGYDTLTSVTIKYMINGVQGAPYYWSGSLPSTSTITNLIIDSAQFNYENYELVAWTESPNDTTDLMISNDTSSYSFFNCPSPFKGTYIIGGPNADFASFNKAVDALNHCGIDSAVVFKVYQGIYTEEVYLDSIPGASSHNTISFTSLSGINTDVILRNPNTQNPAITFWPRACYYNFDYLTIQSTYAVQTIEFGSLTHGFRFTNNVIENISTAFGTSYVIEGKVNNLLLENNNIIGGYYGIYFTYSDTVTIRNNNIKDFAYTGVYYSYGYDGKLLVTENYIRKGNSSCLYPNIHVHNCLTMDLDIEKNVIDGYFSSDGITISYCYGTTAHPILITNNFILMNNYSFSQGMAFDNSMYMNIFNNSVEIYGSNSMDNVAFWGVALSYVNIMNNIFSNLAGGTAYHLSSNSIDSLDFNDVYTSGTVLGDYNTTTFNNLSTLQTLSGKEAHSISVDPSFFSFYDLHINNNPYLNGAAAPVSGVTTDIDGDVRNVLTPDIGADEFNCSIGMEEPTDVNGFYLYQNQPNPASSSTSIYFNLPASDEIIFELINTIGTNIMTKIMSCESGLNSIPIDVTGLPSGIYVYSVTYKGKKLSKRLSITD